MTSYVKIMTTNILIAKFGVKWQQKYDTDEIKCYQQSDLMMTE